MTASTWILVADASVARLFTRRDDGSLDEVRTLAHTASRLSDAELTSDRPGRRAGPGHTRGAAEDRTSAHHREEERFAAEVVRELVEGGFDRLEIVAPPRFLGLLRAKMPKPLAARVEREVPKEFARLSARELAERLSE
jgi:protein required for attachment to host cells